MAVRSSQSFRFPCSHPGGKKEHYLITHTEAKEIFLHKANRAMYVCVCVCVCVYIQAGSKLGKEYIKTVYCHLAYLTYMQSTS